MEASCRYWKSLEASRLSHGSEGHLPSAPSTSKGSATCLSSSAPELRESFMTRHDAETQPVSTLAESRGRRALEGYPCSGPTRPLTPNFWLPPGPQRCFKRLRGTDNIHPGARPTGNTFVLLKTDILQVDTVFRALPHKWNNQLLLNETECTYIPDSFYCRNS